MEAEFKAAVRRARASAAPARVPRQKCAGVIRPAILGLTRLVAHRPPFSLPVAAQLLAVQRVEFPILGMTTQRGNTSVDDLDAEDELEEEEDEELDDIPDTDGEGFETDEVGT